MTSKAKGGRVVDPFRKYAPDHGTDLYQCPQCWHIESEGGYDCIGVDGAKWFCNQRHKQAHMGYIGWIRSNFLSTDSATSPINGRRPKPRKAARGTSRKRRGKA